MNSFSRVVSKVTGGRWVLTVACAFTFSWCAVKGIINEQAIVAILGMVFVSYFQRPDRNGTSVTDKPTDGQK